MKFSSITFVLLFLTLVVQNVSAQNPDMPSQGEAKIMSMSSSVLETERNYSIYLPKSYTADSDRHYPILYLLHGVYDNNTGWLERGHLQDVANRIIDAEQATEMIIVVPDAGTDWNGYFNMDRWPYEDFFFEEFLPYIESNYRVKEGRQNRAIAGLSMGGGGATVYGQKYPDKFSSVYAISALMTLAEDGGLQQGDPKFDELNRTVRENSTIEFVKNADSDTLEDLRSVRWFVDCGDDDFLLHDNLEFVKTMQEAQIPLEFRVRDGGHVWEYWHSALYKILPFVSYGFMQG